jgi:hypothetical protein
MRGLAAIGGGVLVGAFLGAGARFTATGGDEDTERFLWIQGADRGDIPAYIPWALAGGALGLIVGTVAFVIERKKSRIEAARAAKVERLAARDAERASQQ